MFKFVLPENPQKHIQTLQKNKKTILGTFQSYLSLGQPTRLSLGVERGRGLSLLGARRRTKLWGGKTSMARWKEGVYPPRVMKYSSKEREHMLSLRLRQLI